MRLLLLFTLHLCLLPKIQAVTIPAMVHISAGPRERIATANFCKLSAKEIQQLTGRKMNMSERLQWKILQKKFKKLEAADQTSKDTISTIALISGIVGFVLLFFFPIAAFLLLVTAIITGFVGKKNNDNPKSRKKALIGLILGLVAYGLIFIFALAYSGGFG